jgi:hypothetical protein
MIQSNNGQSSSKRNGCPQDIDWSGLRAAAVAIGIRPAARQAAQDLPPDERERFIQRAMKRCSREKWLVKAQQHKADAVVTSPSALSANVRKGSDVLTEVLAEDSRATRIGLSAAARKAAETFAKMPGAKVIKHAQGHRHITASSSQLHGWDEAQGRGQQTLVSVQILNEGDGANGGRWFMCKSFSSENEDQVLRSSHLRFALPRAKSSLCSRRKILQRTRCPSPNVTTENSARSPTDNAL